LPFAFAATLVAQQDAPTTVPATQPAAPQEETIVDAESVLARFAGTWTIEAEWSNGEPLRATNTYVPTLNGSAMRASTVLDLPDGRKYQRYEAFMKPNDDGTISAFVLTFNGQFEQSAMQVKSADIVTNGFDDPVAPVRETITFLDDNRYRWQVEVRQPTTKPAGDGEPEMTYVQMMDGVWTRQSAGGE
ncbi:MAG: hypothetical protein AAGK78_08910, partial [Planctomycetota bacterium]